MRLAIIVPTYRAIDLALACLDSLGREITPGLDRVIVVGNGCAHDDAARLRAGLEGRPWASLVVCATNLGFCGGTNAGLRVALGAPDPPQYCMLLNDDTVLRQGALRALLAFLEAHPDVAIAGAGMEEPDGSPQTSAFRFPTLLSEFEGTVRFGPLSRLLARWCVARPPSTDPRPTDWVPGGAMLMRREVLACVGLLDEQFFMYFDDVDFCRRAARAGFACWSVPPSRIVHLRGQTSGMRSESWSQRRCPAYWYQSRRHYFEKHHGWWYASAADVVVLTGSLLRRALAILRGPVYADPPHFMRDILAHGLLARSTQR